MNQEQLLAPIKEFLSTCAAFEVLGDEALDLLARNCRIDYHPRGKKVMIQGETVLEHVTIIQEGAVELFYESDPTISRDILDEGKLYGGLSLLRNGGLSLRSGITVEDTFLYLIPKEVFFKICSQYPEVRSYFYSPLEMKAYERSLHALRQNRLRIRNDEDSYIMHISVGEVLNPKLTRCAPETSIREAARIMTRDHSGCILVMMEDALVGIITDRDLRREVLAGGMDMDRPVRDLMNSPVKRISTERPVLEALMIMLKGKIAFLPAVDHEGKVRGVISALKLPQVQRKSPLSLIYRIGTIQLPEKLQAVRKKLPGVVHGLFQEGYAIGQINSFIAHINNALIERLVEFAIEKVGEPPCSFAFITLASEGRDEHTLLVGQENAIIFEDTTNPEVKTYFANLSAQICTWLDDAGFSFCSSRVMANNQTWRQPLSQWKAYFSHWIAKPNPASVQNARLFFDFSVVYGDQQLGEQLRDHLITQLAERGTLYFRNMALQHLEESPPIGFFRNQLVVSEGEHKQEMDLKKIMSFIVDFARIFALKYGIRATNTCDRLDLLNEKNLVEDMDFDGLKRGYDFLMTLRLHNQEEALGHGADMLDNCINPFKLSTLDQDILKAVFLLLNKLQLKMEHYFTGRIEQPEKEVVTAHQE